MSETARPLAPRPESRAEEAVHTKERILDAAERLFAERGFEGTSMRAVTRAAGASLSAANYHFGSKEELLRATLRRRVEPVNELRLERLEALEREAGHGPLSLEAVLDVFLRPVFEARAESAEAPVRYRQVAARLYADPPELVTALKRELFGPLVDRFLRAFARALPGRAPAEVALGFQFAVALMVHVISGQLDEAPGMAAGEWPLRDEELLQRMVAYTAAGIRSASGSAAALDAARADGTVDSAPEGEDA